MAVGAAYYQKTPAFGLTPALAEPCSSVGGTPILFDKTGKRLSSPEIRKQPAITAPDGVDTTFFIPGMDSNANGKPDFYGTSAAAPHAAGAAALLYEAHPTLTTEQLYQALTNSAQDMDNPHTPMFDRGFDALTGYGWLQVDAAIQSIPTQLPPTQPTQNVMCNGKKATIIGTSRAEVLNGTKGDDVIAGLGGNDQIFGLDGNDTICGGDGFDLISGGSGLDTCDSERTTKCEYRARQ
jgi:subtilisin family serine protease